MKSTIRRSMRMVGRSTGSRHLARRLSRSYGLRCLLYHEIAEHPSEFTAGLGLTTSPAALAEHLELLSEDYEFVSIDRALTRASQRDPKRPQLLITFDDAYASVSHIAADICQDAGAPSIFFVNGAFVDNRTMALDNLVAWIVNTKGMTPITAAAGRDFRDLKEFLGSYLASLSFADRIRLYDRLVDAVSAIPAEIATKASLYVTSKDLAMLPAKGMTIGNHTWSHVHCRSLDLAATDAEIGRNQDFLEGIVEDPVDVFSYPYGSHVDATDAVTSGLVHLGHRAAFLVDSRMNRRDRDAMRLFRVSAGSVDASDLFTELEVLPVMRSVRDRVRRGV